MSIADHFNRVEEAGFVRSYAPPIARWQFQISLALVVILTVAAFVLEFSFRVDGQTEHRDPTSAHTSSYLPRNGQAFAPRRA
jgi:hypothetical protein